ncbi:MAG: DUF2971 domain-containing protein [Acidaminococcaceae bacterium]
MLLYKYLTPERIDIIENFMIRYTQPEALNDPLEGKIVFDAITSEYEMEQTFHEEFLKELKNQYKQLPLNIRKMVTFKNFVKRVNQEKPNAYEEFKTLIKSATPDIKTSIRCAFDRKIGVLSLTEKPNNMSMWAHYAVGHKGFVLGFDSEHPYFHQKRSESDEFYYLRQVEYHEQKDRVPKKMTELSMEDIFLTKNIEWSYESEWRILAPLLYADYKNENVSPPVYLFKFPPEALKQIIIGENMNIENKEKILHTIRSKSELQHIELKQAKLNVEQFDLDIVDYVFNI